MLFIIRSEEEASMCVVGVNAELLVRLCDGRMEDDRTIMKSSKRSAKLFVHFGTIAIPFAQQQ